MRRWPLLAAGFGINLSLGTVYSWSVFVKPLQERFGASYFEAALPSTLCLALFAVGMLFAGRLVNRWGPRRVATVGVGLVGAGYLASAAVLGLPSPMLLLAVVYGGLVGLGIGFAYSPPIPTAARWFPERKGLATGIVVMGFGLSPLVTAPLVNYLLGASGVEFTFLLLGGVFLLAGLPLAALLRFPPTDFVSPAAPAAKAAAAAEFDLTPREVLRRREFYLLVALYALGTSAGFMAISQAKTIAAEMAGLEAVLAVAAVQWLAVWNCVGRPGFGRLVDTWGARGILGTMFVLEMAGMALLASAGQAGALFAGLALVAAVFGGFLAVMPTLTAQLFGGRNLAANYGLVFLGYGTGGLLGPVLIGAVRDATGGFSSAFVIGVGLCAAGLALATFVRPPKRLATAKAPAVFSRARGQV